LYVPDAIYFITGVTKERAPILKPETDMELFRETMRKAKIYHPFTMQAYVFLYDHFHLLIFVPATTNISKLLQSIQRNYTLNYKNAHGISTPLSLWQRGFWDHVIRNDQDFENHFHYIHNNPVKHGYVTRPVDYPHSSFHEYVERGVYDLDWGASE
jgi:putative transposase